MLHKQFCVQWTLRETPSNTICNVLISVSNKECVEKLILAKDLNIASYTPSVVCATITSPYSKNSNRESYLDTLVLAGESGCEPLISLCQ